MSVQKLRPKEALAKAEWNFFGDQPRGGSVSIEGTCKMTKDESGSLSCMFDLRLEHVYGHYQWDEPLPNIQVTYFTDKTNFLGISKGIPLKHREKKDENNQIQIDKYVVWFEDGISDVNFEECIFIGLEIDKEQVYYTQPEEGAFLGSRFSGARGVPNPLKFCFKIRARQSDNYPKTFKISHPEV